MSFALSEDSDLPRHPSSLQCVLGPSYLNMDSEDSDQTGLMPRLRSEASLGAKPKSLDLSQTGSFHKLSGFIKSDLSCQLTLNILKLEPLINGGYLPIME